MRRLFLLFTLCLTLLAAPASAQLPSNFAPLHPSSIEPVARIGWHPYAALFMPDGQSFAVASNIGVTFFDLSLSKRMHIDMWDHAPHVIAVSPDGRLLATGGDGVRLWDVETGALIDALEAEVGVAGLAFSADGTRLAASKGWGSLGYGGIYVFDVASGRQVTHLANDAIFADIAFHPDGQRLIAQQIYDCCGTIKVIDIETGDQSRIGTEAYGFVVPLDGTSLLASVDGVLWKWKIDALDEAPVISAEPYISGHKSVVRPDGRFDLLTVDGELVVWDTETLTSRSSKLLGFKMNLAAISPDGASVFAVDEKTFRVAVIDVATGAIEEQSYLPTVTGPILLWREELFYTTADHNIRSWNVADGTEMVMSGHTDTINVLAEYLLAGHLYSGSDDGTIRKWTTYNAEPVVLYEKVGAQIVALQHHRENDELYAVICENRQGRLLRLDAETGESLGFYTGGADSASVPSLEVDCSVTLNVPDRETITYADQTHLYKLHTNSADTINAEPLPLRPATTRWDDPLWPRPPHIYFSDRETVLAHRGAAVAWRRSDPELETIASHNLDITAFGVLREGSLYVSAACVSYGYTREGKYCYGADMALTDLDMQRIELRGHSAPVRQIVVNQAQTLFASVSDDGTIIVWGAPLEPQPLQRYGGIHRLG